MFEIVNKIRGRHRAFTDAARLLMPPDESTGVLGRQRHEITGTLVLWIFHINSALIERFNPGTPDVWDPSRFKWSNRMEEALPDIRREVVEYLQAATMPHTAEVSGLDPDTPEGFDAAPVDRGAWRSVILQFFGQWVEENCYHFPATVEALAPIRGVTSIGFTALDARSHLCEHVGPNRGALRYQLPVIVPGQPGASRIRIRDEIVEWQEGRSVLFDLSVNHEAWNDSDETRVLLMIEVPMPLPFPLSIINRMTQSCYRFFPTYRELPERARQLAVERDTAVANQTFSRT